MPGIMEGTVTPDYAESVTVATKAAQSGLVNLALLAIVTPIVIGLVLQVEALGGFLAASSSPANCWRSSCPTPAARGTTPRSSSRTSRAT